MSNDNTTQPQQPSNEVLEILQVAEQIKILTILEQMLELVNGQEKNFQFEVALKLPQLSPLAVAVPAAKLMSALDNWGATITQELLNKQVPVDVHLEQVRQAVRQLKQQAQVS